MSKEERNRRLRPGRSSHMLPPIVVNSSVQSRLVRADSRSAAHTLSQEWPHDQCTEAQAHPGRLSPLVKATSSRSDVELSQPRLLPNIGDANQGMISRGASRLTNLENRSELSRLHMPRKDSDTLLEQLRGEGILRNQPVGRSGRTGMSYSNPADELEVRPTLPELHAPTPSLGPHMCDAQERVLQRLTRKGEISINNLKERQEAAERRHESMLREKTEKCRLNELRRQRNREKREEEELKRTEKIKMMLHTAEKTTQKNKKSYMNTRLQRLKQRNTKREKIRRARGRTMFPSIGGVVGNQFVSVSTRDSALRDAELEYLNNSFETASSSPVSNRSSCSMETCTPTYTPSPIQD